jgi:transcription elongation factor
VKVTIHVSTIGEVSAARTAAEATLQPGDELEVIVGQVSARTAEVQPSRQAVGHPAQAK